MYKKILVPVDGSAASTRGLDEALKLAKSLGASVRIVHAVNEFVLDASYTPIPNYDQVTDALRAVGRKVLDDAQERARAAQMEVQAAILEYLGGSAADLILEDAKNWSTDLIVMGTHGRRGVRRLVLGSDAEQILRLSPVPVLMVRATSEPS